MTVYLDVRFKINTGNLSYCDNELEVAINIGDTICKELKENSICRVDDIEVIGCGKINPIQFSIDECMLIEDKSHRGVKE